MQGLPFFCSCGQHRDRTEPEREMKEKNEVVLMAKAKKMGNEGKESIVAATRDRHKGEREEELLKQMNGYNRTRTLYTVVVVPRSNLRRCNCLLDTYERVHRL